MYNFEFIRVKHIITFKLCFPFKCLSLIFSSVFTDGDQKICVALFVLVHPKSFIHKRINVIPLFALSWVDSSKKCKLILLGVKEIYLHFTQSQFVYKNWQTPKRGKHFISFFSSWVCSVLLNWFDLTLAWSLTLVNRLDLYHL